MQYKTDVVIIGAGAVGSMLARELSKYEVDVVVVEKSSDVGGHSSRSNGATVTSGQDAGTDLLEAQMKVASRLMYEKLVDELDVPFRQVGALTVALTDEELPRLQSLQEEAVRNGVYDAELITAQRAKEIVPSLSDEVRGGFWVPRDAVVDIFELIYACMQNAMENGVRLLLGRKVTDIVVENKCIRSVKTSKGDMIDTRYVVNCGGCYADEIAKMVGLTDYTNYAKAGEMFILDKNLPYAPKCLVNPLPGPESRGILIVPTIHGNTLLGPNVEYRDDVEDTSTTKNGLEQVIAAVQKRIPQINAKDSVTQFTGVRPAKKPGGWQMRAVNEVSGYLEAVGITGAFGAGPAIAVYMRELLGTQGLELKKKDDFNPIRIGIRRFNQMAQAEQDEWIRRNPAYGNIICRCETVTEAEIVEAIHRIPPARTLDAVKRRVRAGMGRCQGGFCSTRVVEILARELGVPVEEICKNEPGSEMIKAKNR